MFFCNFNKIFRLVVLGLIKLKKPVNEFYQQDELYSLKEITAYITGNTACPIVIYAAFE